MIVILLLLIVIEKIVIDFFVFVLDENKLIMMCSVKCLWRLIKNYFLSTLLIDFTHVCHSTPMHRDTSRPLHVRWRETSMRALSSWMNESIHLRLGWFDDGWLATIRGDRQNKCLAINRSMNFPQSFNYWLVDWMTFVFKTSTKEDWLLYIVVAVI